MTLERRTDIASVGLRKLVPAFWGKPRIATVLLGWLDEIQALETAIFDTIEDRLLDNADGVRLRVLGRLVGQKNFGWADDVYRAAIRARIRANRSSGTAVDLREVVELLTPGLAFKVLDTGLPATARITFADVIALGAGDRDALRDILSDTRGAGIRLDVSFPHTADTFTFKASVGAGSDAALGWAGGSWTDLVRT